MPGGGVDELYANAWRLGVDQAVRSFAIETQYPIANDLEPDAAEPYRRGPTIEGPSG